jgi:hypothetical protein
MAYFSLPYTVPLYVAYTVRGYLYQVADIVVSIIARTLVVYISGVIPALALG